MARAATYLGLVLLCSLCLVAGSTRAGSLDERVSLDEPFEITADRIDYDAERALYTADRNVRVVQGEKRLRARWVTFSTETRIGVAEGDVVLVDEDEELRAQFMVFDVDTLQGMLFQGWLDSGSEGFRVEAEELVRTGVNTFALRDGLFSTCRCDEGERLPWQIRAGRGQVELGGYGTVTNSTFEVLGVPVLWVPWAFFPVKSERETGFLLPDFSFGGRGGTSFGVPFLWAALPELNVIVTPRYFSDRGYKQDVELEYVFGEKSEGRLFTAGLSDASEKDSSPYRKSRWSVIWEHDHFLPAEWRWQTDLKLSSDNLYADDFQELRHYRAFRFVESSTNVARDFGSSGGFGAMVAMRFADDLQGSTFDDGDETILQRWTEGRGDIQPGAVVGPLGIEARLDSEFIYFSALRSPSSEINDAPRSTRTDGRFFDVGINGRVNDPPSNGEGNGVFDLGEPIDDYGGRLVVHPRLARPFKLGGVAEFVPEIGWQQTLYRTASREFAERGLFTARAELRSRVGRDFLWASGKAMRHVVEPSLGWAVVSQRRQRSNPLFIPRPTVEQSRLRVFSLENVTRNPSDRIESTNQMVFAVNQRFFTSPRRRSGLRLRADLATAVDWGLDGTGLGNLTLDARLFPRGLIGTRVRGSFNPESVAVREGSAELSMRLPIENQVVNRLDLIGRYRYLRRLPEFVESQRGSPSNSRDGDTELNQFDITTRIELFRRVRLSYTALYSLSVDSGFIRNRGLLEYVSKCRCWGVGVTVQEERRQGWSGGFSIRFLGLGDEQGNLFGGGFGGGVEL